MEISIAWYDFDQTAGGVNIGSGTVQVGDLLLFSSNLRATGTASAPAVTLSGTATTTAVTQIDNRRYDTGGTSDGAARTYWCTVTAGGSLTFSTSGSNSYYTSALYRDAEGQSLTINTTTVAKREGSTNGAPTALSERAAGSSLIWYAQGGGGSGANFNPVLTNGDFSAASQGNGVNGGYHKCGATEVSNDRDILTPGTTTVNGTATVNGGAVYIFAEIVAA